MGFIPKRLVMSKKKKHGNRYYLSKFFSYAKMISRLRDEYGTRVKNGYIQYFSPKKNDWVFMHITLCIAKYNKTMPGHHVHHIDHNKQNNTFQIN